MMKQLHKLMLIAFTLLFISCGAFMYGLTEDDAFGRYMKVSEATQSFGYKRLQYNVSMRGKDSPIQGIILEKGLPEYIYEFEEADGCDGIVLYYTEMDSAFMFVEQDRWDIESSRFIKSFEINASERAKFPAY